jgi:hypothetical protein
VNKARRLIVIVKAIAILVVVYGVPGDPSSRERTWTDPVPHTPTYSTLASCRADLTKPKLGAALWNRVLDHAAEELPGDAVVRRLAAHVRCERQTGE